MDEKRVEGESEAVFDNNAAQFHKSLKELRAFSSQLYHAADYCKTAFLSSSDKTRILETTKEYVSRAVVVVVDHLGAMSANLECCISKSSSVSETEHKIDSLKQRIGTCQNYSYKISLARFHWGADFSRYHCRYISPLKNSSVPGYVSSYFKICIDAKNEDGTLFEEAESLHLDTYSCKPSVVECSSSDMKKKNVAPASLIISWDYKNMKPADDDGLSILQKIKNPVFHFQEAEKIKNGAINWKQIVQNRDIAALIKRGKRLLA